MNARCLDVAKCFHFQKCIAEFCTEFLFFSKKHTEIFCLMLELILRSTLLGIMGIQGIGFSSQFPDSGSVLISLF